MQGVDYIYGLHAVKAVLKSKPQQVSELFVLSGRHDQRLQELSSLAQKHHIHLTQYSREQLELLVTGNHQGVVAAIVPQQQLQEAELYTLVAKAAGPVLLLILDGVQDPHNLGACLRSANAAGVQAVVAPKDRAVGLTAAVRRVACGAAETTPFIQVTNLVRTIKKLQELGVWVYGATPEAELPLYKVDMSGSVALILGAEELGLRQLTKKSCDGLFTIPMQGEVASLNVSVATGICLFEAVRQRYGGA